MSSQETSGTICLPFARPVDARPAISEPTRANPTRALRILVAEDDHVNQIFIDKILKKKGHQVTLAQDGRETIDLWAEHDFDCILMDIQMPRMTGVEATREIRRREQEMQAGKLPSSWRDREAQPDVGVRMTGREDKIRRPSGARIPIIAVTAHTLAGDRENFLGEGMDGYLPKPVDGEELEKVLRGML